MVSGFGFRVSGYGVGFSRVQVDEIQKVVRGQCPCALSVVCSKKSVILRAGLGYEDLFKSPKFQHW
jgi:hypothetical protein